jgi:hypothetical protein
MPELILWHRSFPLREEAFACPCVMHGLPQLNLMVPRLSTASGAPNTHRQPQDLEYAALHE